MLPSDLGSPWWPSGNASSWRAGDGGGGGGGGGGGSLPAISGGGVKICTLVPTLPDAGRREVSARTARPGVSMLWMDRIAGFTCNFYTSAACSM